MRGVFDAMSFSDQAGVRAWFGLIVTTTNALWCGDAVGDRALARRGPATVAQSTALERLLGVCTSFVELNPGGAKILDVAALMFRPSPWWIRSLPSLPVFLTT